MTRRELAFILGGAAVATLIALLIINAARPLYGV